MLFKRVLLKLRSLVEESRANYYGLFYKVGRGCRFQKVSFGNPANDIMGRNAIKIGNSVTIWRGTELVAFNDRPISIGDNTFINKGCTLTPNLTIGENVSIGHNVSLISNTHKIGTSQKRAGEAIFPPIVIGNGVWVGANSTILGGVSIGDGTIIAAGAVVTKDCLPNSIYAGVPARLIRHLD